MIRAKIQIEGSVPKDTYAEWGLIYKVGDRRFSPPEKKVDEVSYPEEAGVHISDKTVYDKFDYTVSFIISTKYGDANEKIKKFNDDIRDKRRNKVVRYKKITLYDYYKRCKIVGYPKLLEEVKENDYNRREGQDDCVVVDLTITVVNPKICDFNLLNPEEGDNVELSLYVDNYGQLQWNTSRPLNDNENVTLLTCGRKRARHDWNDRTDRNIQPYKKSRYKWHVIHREHLLGNGYGDWVEGLRYYIDKYTTWEEYITVYLERRCVFIRKAPNSKKLLPFKAGVKGKICYALAAYRYEDNSKGGWANQTRISNVAYFYSNVEVTDNNELHQWISV